MGVNVVNDEEEDDDDNEQDQEDIDREREFIEMSMCCWRILILLLVCFVCYSLCSTLNNPRYLKNNNSFLSALLVIYTRQLQLDAISIFTMLLIVVD